MNKKAGFLGTTICFILLLIIVILLIHLYLPSVYVVLKASISQLLGRIWGAK